MSGRRRQGVSPTLFPFLAVLICMLGTLILLLAVVTQEAAKAQAQAPTAELAAGPDPEQEALAQAAADLQRQLREARWHREQTVKMRNEQTAELERRRDELAHLEDHLRRLRDELKLLNTEVEKTLSDDDDAATAQATLDTLLAQIEDEKQAIGELEQSLQTRTPRIVIVPHKGPNGTDRRPIYIQCRADGVYLQPGGEHITLAELEFPSGRSNPLGAALRVIRHHAMQTYGDTVAPYPLLVVSPDGIETYAITRSAMKDWDDQFGYELVPAEVELAFPAADPALNEKVALAIRQAVAQQQMLAAGSRGGYGRGHSAGAYRGSPSGSGEGHLNAAPAGLAAGTSSEAIGGGGGSGPAVLAAAANSEAGAGGAAFADARSPRPASQLPVLSAAELARGAHPSTTRSPFASSTSGTSESPLGGYPGTATHAAGQPLMTAQSGEKGQPGQSGSPAELGPHTEGGSPDAAADPATGGGSATGNQAAAIGQFNPAGDAAARSAAAGGPGGPSASAPLAGTESTGDAPAPDRQPSGGVSAQVAMHTTPPVTRVGKDWGLPSSLMSSRGTEMLRMIRVECYTDRFVLLPERGVGTNTTFAFADGDIDRATLELATAVRDRAAGWGAAMQGARWQPVLDVAVVRGGEASYQELLRLMEGSGVVIQARGTR